MNDNHSNQRSKHNLSCALLTCAEGLLDAGLETIIIDTFKKLSKNKNNQKGQYNINSFSSISISNMCSIIILSQSSIIIQSLIDLLDRYNVTVKHHHENINRDKKNNNNDTGRHNLNDINDDGDDDDSINDDVYMNHTYEMLEDNDKKTSINMCKVSYGQYGRMLITDQGINRGFVVIKEYPYVCVRSNACKCQSKSSSSLLPSHILMAIYIYKYHGYSLHKYELFMKTFYSGLYYNTFNDNIHNNNNDHDDHDYGNYGDDRKHMDIYNKDRKNKNQQVKSDNDSDNIHSNFHRSSSSSPTSSSSSSSSSSTFSITRAHSVTWSLRQQCLFSLIASIYCLYKKYIFKASNYKDALKGHHYHHNDDNQHHHNDDDNQHHQRNYSSKHHSQYHYNSKRPANLEGNINFHSEKKQFLQDSWLFTQILSRLPHNVHAITKVMESYKDNKYDIRSNSYSSSSSSFDDRCIHHHDDHRYHHHHTTTTTSTPTTTTDNTTSTTTTNTNSILESNRIGIALFLHASCINHSCDPNAIIRFNSNSNNYNKSSRSSSSSSSSRGEKSSSSTTSSSSQKMTSKNPQFESSNDVNHYHHKQHHHHKSNDNYNNGSSNNNNNNNNDRNQKYDVVMEYLRNVYIEIVSTMPINRNTEITISYGPIKGRFEVNLRKQILFCQYLFYCHCIACRIDNDKNNNNNNNNTNISNNKISNNNDIDKIKNQCQSSSSSRELISSTPTSTSSTSKNIENVIYLCNRLQQLTEEMYYINANYSELIQNNIIISYQHNKHNNDNKDSDMMKKLIINFQEKCLYKMIEKFQELQKIYFPAVSEIKMFSRNNNINKSVTTDIINNNDSGTKSYNDRMSYNWDNRCSSNCNNYDNDNYLRIYKKFPYYQQQLFIEFCTLLCNYNDVTSHLLSLSYQYHHAIDLIKYNIYLMIISGMYKIDDIVIGRERSKLAGLLLKTSSTITTFTTTTTTIKNHHHHHHQCNNYHECLYQAYESMKILQPIVSNDDPDLIEMQQIIYYLQNS